MPDSKKPEQDRFPMPPLTGDEALRRHRDAIGADTSPENELSSLPIWQRLGLLVVGVGVMVVIVLASLYLSM